MESRSDYKSNRLTRVQHRKNLACAYITRLSMSVVRNYYFIKREPLSAQPANSLPPCYRFFCFVLIVPMGTSKFPLHMYVCVCVCIFSTCSQILKWLEPFGHKSFSSTLKDKQQTSYSYTHTQFFYYRTFIWLVRSKRY